MAIELERAIGFGEGGNGQTLTRDGWSQPEPAFTWVIGAESTIRIPVEPNPVAYFLTLDVVPFIHRPHLPRQRLIVSVNGIVLGSSALSRPTLLGYLIPADIVGLSGTLDIRLQHPDGVCPTELGISADRRMLSFSLSEARLYRADGLHVGGMPRGLMMNGAEGQDFDLPDPVSRAAWVAARTGLDLATLALRFESIGENCEFGLVQRHCDAEPLGLLRFSSTFLRPLIRGLDDGFQDLGQPGDVEPRLEGDGRKEFMIHDRAYGLVYHSFVYEGQRTADQMREQEAVRLKFLRRKFMEELQRGEKIFVYKRNTAVPEEEILPLLLALRRHGDNTLLWVVPSERDRPPGTVEIVMRGLMKGYIDRFAPEDNAHDFSFDGWMRVCANAVALAGLSRTSG